MEIIQKIVRKGENLYEAEPVTIAFLGDSITQGCFEMLETPGGKFQGVCDQESGYQNKLKKLLIELFPNVPITTVNAGIGGCGASNGFRRLERDVLSRNPDLVVVCFGLNDAIAGMTYLEEYTESLQGIFEKLQARGIEVIFMTPNMMATKDGGFFANEELKQVTQKIIQRQNDGVLECFLNRARKVCEEMHVPICDCYRTWEKMAKNGVDTDRLLANHMNHPTRQMHWLFAVELLRIMFA